MGGLNMNIKTIVRESLEKPIVFIGWSEEPPVSFLKFPN